MGWKDLLRLLLLLLLWSVLAVQVFAIVSQYLEGDTVTVTTDRYEKNFYFPSFGLCPFSQSVLSGRGSVVVDERNMTDVFLNQERHEVLLKVWQAFTDDPQFFPMEYLEDPKKGPMPVDSKFRDVFTVFGPSLEKCVIYEPTRPSKSGRDNKVILLFNTTGLSRVNVKLHNAGMYLTSSSNFHGSYQLTLGVPDEEFDSNVTHMEVPVFEYTLVRAHETKIRKKNYNCRDQEEEENDETVEECYESFITTEMGCKLPWKSDDGTICETEAEFKTFKNISDVFDSYSLLEIQELTQCIPPCGRVTHFAEHNSERTIILSRPNHFTTSMMTLSAYYTTSSFAASREVLRYEGKAAFADFGGYLGLLLGFSALSLYDVALEGFEKLKAAFARKKKRVLVVSP